MFNDYILRTGELSMDESLVSLQECQLNILNEIERVCKENGLCYCLAFGSCLGAVRHQGFIPWDDDIDIYMPIKEFKKLKTLSKEFKEPYFLQTKESDSEYGLMIGRVRNSNTTLLEETEIDRDINHGIFVDIYPLFNTPDKGVIAELLILCSMIHRLFLYGVVPKNRGKLMKVGSQILLKIVPKSVQHFILKNTFKYMCNQPKTGYVSTLYGDELHIKYREKMLFPVKYVPFERGLAPIPNDADSYLALTYGDYMKLPPKEKQCFHHNYVKVDLENSYKSYKGVLYCKK
jgi:lipopolysaccharide cholinephosphotransferase